MPKPTLLGTALLLAGLAITSATLEGDRASSIARYAAYGTAISIGASVLVDITRGVRNLIRADLMGIIALFFLTLFEFFYKQTDFDTMVDRRTVMIGVQAVLMGFAGLAVGRHLPNLKKAPFNEVFTTPLSPKIMMVIFWLAMIVGYFHQFLAVNFNPSDVFMWYLEPRFTAPWGRGKFGDWKALITELGLLIYLIPPLAGVMLAKRHAYTRGQLTLVSLGLAWTMFFGFSGGTRNVFACFLVTFMIAYNFALPKNKTKEFLIVAGTCAVLMLVSTKVMLEFRNMGLRNYLEGNQSKELDTEQTLFVDYNLYVICGLAQVFPDRVPYLGWQVPYLALIRPVPRAMWPGKPEGLSEAIEDALGVEGLTLASSFVGEAYIANGYYGVFWAGLFFGIMAGWWSHLASPRNSDFGILIYASGFFATVISMRSLFVFTTAILPTMAAIVGGSILVSKLRAQQANRPPPPPRFPRQ
ncbi:MAG: hypothetical protein PHD76_04085 [Methylacidiphilales bacterium]|nr:hypothetical protein [Candidatus Methylacidiphilales bacterium]